MKRHPQARAAALAGLNEWDPTARRRGFLALCLLPALVVLVLVLVYPLFYNVLLSFSDASIHRIRGWKFAGLSQYLLVFREPEFWITFHPPLLEQSPLDHQVVPRWWNRGICLFLPQDHPLSEQPDHRKNP